MVQFLTTRPPGRLALGDALVVLVAVLALLLDLRSTTVAILLGLLVIVWAVARALSAAPALVAVASPLAWRSCFW